MELMGLCSQCGRPGILHTCPLCGAHVCSRCFDTHHCANTKDK